MLFEPTDIDEFTLAASLNNAIIPSTNAIVYTLFSENQYP
jgi:hypothetical protein